MSWSCRKIRPSVLESDSATTLQDQPVRIAALANDIDPDGDASTVTSAMPAQGSVVINADGTLTYLADEALQRTGNFIIYNGVRRNGARRPPTTPRRSCW